MSEGDEGLRFRRWGMAYQVPEPIFGKVEGAMEQLDEALVGLPSPLEGYAPPDAEELMAELRGVLVEEPSPGCLVRLERLFNFWPAEFEREQAVAYALAHIEERRQRAGAFGHEFRGYRIIASEFARWPRVWLAQREGGYAWLACFDNRGWKSFKQPPDIVLPAHEQRLEGLLAFEHPHVRKLRQLWRSGASQALGGVDYMALEYVPGLRLPSLLRALSRGGPTSRGLLVAAVVAQMASGLDALYGHDPSLRPLLSTNSLRADQFFVGFDGRIRLDFLLEDFDLEQGRERSDDGDYFARDRQALCRALAAWSQGWEAPQELEFSALAERLLGVLGGACAEEVVSSWLEGHFASEKVVSHYAMVLDRTEDLYGLPTEAKAAD